MAQAKTVEALTSAEKLSVGRQVRQAFSKDLSLRSAANAAVGAEADEGKGRSLYWSLVEYGKAYLKLSLQDESGSQAQVDLAKLDACKWIGEERTAPLLVAVEALIDDHILSALTALGQGQSK